MENMTSAQLAQLLYVAYYGRPADPAGLEFWSAQIDEVGVQGIAADFGTSAEFDARFGDLGSVALINNLYQQLFGRDAEAEGLQYWLDVLSEGTPLASIALEIANGAQGGDATGLQNKVTLAAQFTAAVAAGSVAYEGEAAANYGRDFLATINQNTNVEAYDVQAVVDAIESGELPVDTADLRTALEELRIAEEAVEDFLTAAIENEDVAAEAAVDAEIATRADIEAAVATTAGEVETQLGLGAGDFANAGANTQAGLIADGRADAQTVIETQESELADLNEAIDAIEGLRAALNNYSAAVTAEEEATAALAEAEAVLLGADATFDARNAGVTVDDTTTPGTVNITGASSEVNFVLNEETNQYEVEVVTGEESDFVGLTDLLNAYQGVATAEASLDAAQADVAETALVIEGDDDNDGILDTLTQAEKSALSAAATAIDGAADITTATGLNSVVNAGQEDVATAEEALADLNDAVAAWEATVALEAELTTLEDAETAARDFITNAEDEGGLGFNLIEDFGAASTANDVYLFEDNVGAGNAVDVANFGDSGVDRIFFGPDYKLVMLGEGETINDRVGSSSDLEIFWNQGETGLELFVESAVTSGSATNDLEIAQITLTGVNAEDISFNSGFLSAGTATEVA